MIGITELIIGIGVAVAVFFLFRGINLWYWKINDLIKNQENQEELLVEQNKMLERIFIQLGGSIKSESIQRKNDEISKDLDVDLEEVEKMKKNISKDELIVKVKLSGRIEKWKKSDWNEIIKIGNQDKFELIFSNEK